MVSYPVSQVHWGTVAACHQGTVAGGCLPSLQLVQYTHMHEELEHQAEMNPEGLLSIMLCFLPKTPPHFLGPFLSE